MITINYSTRIAKSPSEVWEKLWDDQSYRKWTSAFMEGSYAESTWREGDRIAFKSPDNNGMFGIIEKKVENKEMIFRHQGEIKNGVDEKMDWKDATEGYHLSEVEGGTLLKVLITMDDDKAEYQKYFDEAFPKALAILKDICEN